jgi:hypothetical protein
VDDDHGSVHVFWSEDTSDEPLQPGSPARNGNSILYTRWDGQSWSPVTDILYLAQEPIAEFVAVDVDTEDRLNVVWTGQSAFYFSSALASQAESPRAWSEPIVVAANSARSGWESDIAADAYGNLHIVYATRGAAFGVYHTQSRDGGESWSIATELSEPRDPLEASFSNVKIETDQAGRLHVVWQTNQEEGFGQAIYYARSINGGQSWSVPVQLEYRDPGDTFVQWPYLATVGESELHLVYTNGTIRGRAYRVSLDGGKTWSDPVQVLTELEGINGYVIPLLDDAGGLHMVANMRTRADQVIGIYHSRWAGNEWSPSRPVDVTSPAAPSAHYAAATVRLGNEIHVVYNQIDGGEIWYLHGVIPWVDPLPISPYPQVQTPTPPSPTPTSATVSPTPLPVRPLATVSSSAFNPTVTNVLLPSAGLVLILMVGAILLTRIRS